MSPESWWRWFEGSLKLKPFDCASQVLENVAVLENVY